MLKIAEDFRKAKNVDVDISFTIQEDLLQEDHQRADRPARAPTSRSASTTTGRSSPSTRGKGSSSRPPTSSTSSSPATSRSSCRSPTCYNNEAKKRAYYGVPIEAQTMHIHYWRDLVKEAGMNDDPAKIPMKWKELLGRSGSKAQDALRKKDPAKYGKVYGIGMTESSQRVRHHLQLRDGAPLLRRARVLGRRQGRGRPAEEPRGDRQDADVLRRHVQLGLRAARHAQLVGRRQQRQLPLEVHRDDAEPLGQHPGAPLLQQPGQLLQQDRRPSSGRTARTAEADLHGGGEDDHHPEGLHQQGRRTSPRSSSSSSWSPSASPSTSRAPTAAGSPPSRTWPADPFFSKGQAGQGRRGGLRICPP